MKNDFHLGSRKTVIRSHYERGYFEGKVENTITRLNEAIIQLETMGDSVTDWTKGNPCVLFGRGMLL